MARTRDSSVDSAITDATFGLLVERGFAGMSVESVAERAGVGKPAIYRRYRNKAELVSAVVRSRLPELDPPDLGDTKAELWASVEQGFPADGEAYVGLIGGLLAERERHPELIAAFRESILAPRRAAVRAVIERGQARGDVRTDLAAEAALDLLAGPFLARVFAGEDTRSGWRRESFEVWWKLIEERSDR